MKDQLLFISYVTGLTIFLFVIFFAAIQYNKSLKRSRRGKEQKDEWLFHDFYLKVYSAIFQNTDADEAAVKIGINVEKYYKNCELTRTKPNVKKIVVNTIYGLLLFPISILLSLTISSVFCFIGAIFFLLLVYREQQKIGKKAEEMRLQVSSELPRFLDLLQSELIVGMPIENAIYIIAEKFDSLLSREFLEAMNEMELGISGWQQAIEKVATKYGIETLSEFVLDVSTSYSKGVSIADTVVRKTKEIKETHLLNIKERAGKATNKLVLETTIFQIAPMIVYIMFPVMVTLFQI